MEMFFLIGSGISLLITISQHSCKHVIYYVFLNKDTLPKLSLDYRNVSLETNSEQRLTWQSLRILTSNSPWCKIQVTASEAGLRFQLALLLSVRLVAKLEYSNNRVWNLEFQPSTQNANYLSSKPKHTMLWKSGVAVKFDMCILTVDYSSC